MEWPRPELFALEVGESDCEYDPADFIGGGGDIGGGDAVKGSWIKVQFDVGGENNEWEVGRVLSRDQRQHGTDSVSTIRMELLGVERTVKEFDSATEAWRLTGSLPPRFLLYSLVGAAVEVYMAVEEHDATDASGFYAGGRFTPALPLLVRKRLCVGSVHL